VYQKRAFLIHTLGSEDLAGTGKEDGSGNNHRLVVALAVSVGVLPQVKL
jgi:hypothetical protein